MQSAFHLDGTDKIWQIEIGYCHYYLQYYPTFAQVYTNCSCIGEIALREITDLHEQDSTFMSATDGICQVADCVLLPLFCIMLFAAMFLQFIEGIYVQHSSIDKVSGLNQEMSRPVLCSFSLYCCFAN